MSKSNTNSKNSKVQNTIGNKLPKNDSKELDKDDKAEYASDIDLSNIKVYKIYVY
jgi:hypothetical protein